MARSRASLARCAIVRAPMIGRAARDTFAVSSSLFLRALGVVYVFAFVSLAVQVKGLAGHDGILPADMLLQALQNQLGAERFLRLPTLFWMTGASDAWLVAACWAGAFISFVVACGFLPGAGLLAAWLLYLSLTNVCRTFLYFQWDILLIETGLLALFLAPWGWRGRLGARPVPAAPAIFLLRWLLFRLMFSSGVVKLSSGDPTWWDLRALDVHYFTQPLPTWTAWWAHQMPRWWHSLECALMFFIELVSPFFIFAPRRPRRAAAACLIGFQTILIATGNYAYFNYLTLALCLLLLDDALWPLWIRRRLGLHRSASEIRPSASDLLAPEATAPLLPQRRWPVWVTVPVVAFFVILGTADMTRRWGLRLYWPPGVESVEEFLQPFHVINAYGLFAAMTTTRKEIVVEGSDDSQVWQAYEFRYKPGDPMRAPRFVAPHQPRLDWQMWFAALSSYRSQPWFQNFLVRLLQGSPDVLALLQRNPFPDHPPRYIRSRLYDYRFTDLGTRRATGAWWERTEEGLYSPIQSLRAAP
jgi:hypothetical protein